MDQEFPRHLARELIGHSMYRILINIAGPIHALVYSRDGQYVLSASADRSIKLWNPSTGLCIKTYNGHGKDVMGIALPLSAADNTRFVSCSIDRAVIMWDVVSGKPIRRFSGHQARVNAVDLNSDASVIASGSYDASVRLWDCKSHNRAPIQVLEDAKDSIESITIAQNEIMTSSVDGCIRRYDVRKGLLTTDRISCPVTYASFSCDKNCILASCLDSKLRLLDKSNGQLLAEFKGHKNTQFRISNCFGRNDANLIGGSEDGNIYIWDLLEGTVLATLENHQKSITSVQYNPKREELISGSVDGKVGVWVDDNLFVQHMETTKSQ